MAIDLNKTMRPAEIDLANKLNGVGSHLFSGTWQQGDTITVNDLDKYSLFAVYVQGETTPILVFSNPRMVHFKGNGGIITATPVGWLYAVSASRNGNSLTLTAAGYQRIDTHAITLKTVTDIYGII